jgi:hypothetical protein
METWSNHPDGVIFLVGNYDDNGLYLLQVAPFVDAEVSMARKIVSAVYNHKKTIAGVAAVATLGTCAYLNNAYGIRMMLNQGLQGAVNLLEKSKERVVNLSAQKGFVTDQQFDKGQSGKLNLAKKSLNFVLGKGFKTNEQLNVKPPSALGFLRESGKLIFNALQKSVTNVTEIAINLSRGNGLKTNKGTSWFY